MTVLSKAVLISYKSQEEVGGGGGSMLGSATAGVTACGHAYILLCRE